MMTESFPHTFTVFTSSHNREALLARVFESLERQTFSDFEWIIVDDGSTDGTADLVRSWQEHAPFPIRYLWQEKSGWHVALNVAVRVARGRFFNNLDSDDWYPPRSLERFLRHWESLPSGEEHRYSDIVGLCAFEDGTLLNESFPEPVLDTDELALKIEHRLTGDRARSHRTEILREYPFPEDLGDFVTETFVWNRIAAAGYRCRCVNEILKFVEYQPRGLTARTIAIRARSPAAARTYYREFANGGRRLPFRWAFRTYANHARYLFHQGASLVRIATDVQSFTYAFITLPVGAALFLRDRLILHLEETSALNLASQANPPPASSTESTPTRHRLLHVTTVPMSLPFLSRQAEYMGNRGFEVAVISSPGPQLDRFAEKECVPHVGIRMTRRMSPLRDLVSLGRLVATLRRIRPTIVHAHTPKAGLLAMLAGAIVRTPVRIYHMRGCPAATAKGWRRTVLETADRLACRLAHRVVCVSESLREEALDRRLCTADKMRVLASGSGQGVDAADRFDPEKIPDDERSRTRERLHIPDDALVVGFVGRLVRDKGVVDLVDAFEILKRDYPSLHLLLVGPFEDRDPIPAEVRRTMQDDPRIHLRGPDWDTPRLYATMDVVALPSYREGFPNVPLEAAAMERPVVATRVIGCVDAVRHGETGLLVPAKNAMALADALSTYLASEEMRHKHGRAGRRLVLEKYRPEEIWAALLAQYRELLTERTEKRRGHPQVDSWQGTTKRVLDLTVGAVALLLLSPLVIATAIAILLTSGRPILFRQERPGMNGELFPLTKFRTMEVADPAAAQVRSDQDRVTRLGAIIRRWSIDEIPQLWNVIRGDMSLVGPRPLLEEYLPLYTPAQNRRHRVRPGITGWTQVNGRNQLSWEEKLWLDRWYVDNWSLSLDLKILLRTLMEVVLGRGISRPGYVTTPRFHGRDG